MKNNRLSKFLNNICIATFLLNTSAKSPTFIFCNSYVIFMMENHFLTMEDTEFLELNDISGKIINAAMKN